MHVIVIGAGPAGLACAACLIRAGAEVTVLERADTIGSAWHRHYDRLVLHTTRARSALPHLPMPPGGRYPTRREIIAYLDSYAAQFGIAPLFGAEVTSVRPTDGGWQVAHAGGTLTGDAVVFATGLNGTPRRPELPGEAGFPGPILHSSAYRRPSDLPGERVLVIGLGNTAGDIAIDLTEAGRRVTLSVRGPVNLLPKELFGIPVTSMGGLRKLLPYALADRLIGPILRAATGRPERYGLQAAAKGPAAQVIEDGRVPLIDPGVLPLIRAGRVAVKAGLRRLEGDLAHFADDTTGQFDAILLATGYHTDLRPLLPDTPEALDAAGRPLTSGAPGPLPGLYFCSFRASADGQLRQTGIEAEAIADDLLGRPALE